MKQQVSNFDELYPNRFLKAGLVENKPTYTISEVYVEELGDDNKKKGVVKFSDAEMELTLNKTNGLCLRAMFGSDLSAWIGKRITLCSEKDKFGRDTVDAVRVYGSPDIADTMTVEIKLPKRAAKTRTLHFTGKRKTQFYPVDAQGELTEQMNKLMAYFRAEGLEKTLVALEKYDITTENMEIIKGQLK
jgi:hypothetical protein